MILIGASAVANRQHGRDAQAQGSGDHVGGKAAEPPKQPDQPEGAKARDPSTLAEVPLCPAALHPYKQAHCDRCDQGKIGVSDIEHGFS